MPHSTGRARRRLFFQSLAVLQASGTTRAAERQVGWYCGGRKATTEYMNRPEVRAAMHVPANFSGRWAVEKELKWNCSQDDEQAFLKNYTTCHMTDFRPMIKALALRYP